MFNILIILIAYICKFVNFITINFLTIPGNDIDIRTASLIGKFGPVVMLIYSARIRLRLVTTMQSSKPNLS